MIQPAHVSPESLVPFRVYLRRLARVHLGCRLSSKLDPSDIVQQTLLDALERLTQFRGSTEAELAAWLREIFVNNLADIFRAFNTQKRDIARERSADRMNAWVKGIPPCPNDQAEETEHVLRLAWALSELPEPQHVAIELHHLQGRSLGETASILHRTEASVAGLVRRGLVRLRELLAA